MEKKIPLTQKHFDELTAKLNYLKTEGKAEVALALKTAKEFGDLSENAEYTAAKDAQQKLETDIVRLEEILSVAYPIDMSLISTKTVQVGLTVKVLFDGDDEEDAETYTIVNPLEVDTTANKISDESPLGKALIGKQAGDGVTFKSPGGAMIDLKILEITK
ncbi:MAG TPA: transcription elongation factor GreA [Candidatus Stercoripulliclostridium merdigallinarum]|uniref:Transcription elongation factor GreA n=1 Tax=Candidatus Stercoripulliclostridium merdigallinarum TaxID=2840951 RepID=A0A9D1MGX4_9FIRM|nr:transcription elongation factor GreA [Candidatus Stercoripulliclostridium merdigallinarum]